MRRIVLLVTLVAVMAAMVAASAITASAAEGYCTWTIDYHTGEETFVCY